MVAKRYIVCDEYSDYKNISDYKDLKRLLISELEQDTLNNGCEKDIVESNFKVMKKLAMEDYVDYNYLKEQLQSYGWYIQDIVDLYSDLSNFQAYLDYIKNNDNIEDNKNIQEVLDLIEKVGK